MGAQQHPGVFVGPQEEVYEGMIIGEIRAPKICRAIWTKTSITTLSGRRQRHSTRTGVKDESERAIEYLAADEYVEATPKNLRLRKKILNATQRKRSGQAQRDIAEA